MPRASLPAVELNYEIMGAAGPWVTLMPGGRRALDEISGLAKLVSDAGFRVLLHDRRNTGLSGLSLEGEGSEFEIWADDLWRLLQLLKIDSVTAIGTSSGCRVSTILTLRKPELVNALVMMRVTGGPFAVKRLAHRYYTKFIEAAESGGMTSVCGIDDFRNLIQRVPARETELLSWDVGRFISVMMRWRSSLKLDLNNPILGATHEQLKSIKCPICIIPGNDRTHSLDTGRLVHRLISHSEIHEPRTDQLDLDLLPMEEWASNDVLSSIIVDFLKRLSN